MERAAVPAGGDLGLGAAGILAGAVGKDGLVGVEGRVEGVDAGEDRLGQLDGRELAALEERGDALPVPEPENGEIA